MLLKFSFCSSFPYVAFYHCDRMLQVNNIEKKGSLDSCLRGFIPCLLAWPDHGQLAERQTITTRVPPALW